MKEPLEDLLRALARHDVNEGAVASGRFPSVKVGGAWQAVSKHTLSTDEVLGALTRLGGGHTLESLGEKPVRWTFRVRSLGALAITAMQRGDDIRAQLLVSERERAVEPHTPRKSVLPTAPRKSERPSGRKSMPPRKSIAPAKPSERPTRKSLLRIPAQTAPVAIHEASPAKGGGREIDLEIPAVLGGAVVVATPARPRNDEALLDALLLEARTQKASDLHLVAGRPPLFRLASALTPRGEALPVDQVERLLLAQIPQRLRATFEREGSCDFSLEHPVHGRARVNVARQRTGLKACMRLIASEVPTLESLGLPPEIARGTHHHQGLIVVTGPTGHGKTSTLAAMVDLINRETTHHVITVEDPVEFVHPRKKAVMSQREVGTHTRSFQAALKASLREDPDVIVVGELRDTETVAMALAASETGHLVLGTMNTPSAAKTIDRLIDLFPPGDQQQVRTTLAGGLKLIVGQRLVPSADRTRMHVAAELLPGSIALWNLIREQKTWQIPSLQQRGKALGIVRLDDSLGDLVRAGKIALDDALPFAEAPDALAQALRGAARRTP